MRCEFPELTRCCFCFPLRLGLLTWTYIKTISMAVLLSLSFFGFIHDCTRQCRRHHIAGLWYLIPIWSMLAMDVIFNIMFIISAHKKEHRKMRLFYRYSIFSLLIYISGLILSISMLFVDPYYLYAVHFVRFFHIAVLMWLMLIQIYVIILVRSEFMKLKRNSNFQFVNHAAEPDVTKVDLRDVEVTQY